MLITLSSNGTLINPNINHKLFKKTLNPLIEVIEIKPYLYNNQLIVLRNSSNNFVIETPKKEEKR